MERLIFDGIDKGFWKYRIIQINDLYYLLRLNTINNQILEMEKIEQDELLEYIKCNL